MRQECRFGLCITDLSTGTLAGKRHLDQNQLNFLLSQYGPVIFSQVDFNRGRVRPNFSVDMAGGAELYRKEQRSAVFQIQVSNLADRVNVINFASLFSGTAVAPPRSVSARLRLMF